jgi:divinyl chlorophyllide a 8-vinyl-reductase
MSSPRRHVLLAGSSGHIGSAVASELLARGIDHLRIVRTEFATARPGDAGPGACAEIVAPATDAGGLDAALEGHHADVAISCLASRTGVPQDAWQVDYTANRNLLAAAQRIGVKHFILLSAICVQKPRLAFQRAKLAFEAELMDSGIDFTIVRPTAFFKSLSGQVERVRGGKPFLVFGDGRSTASKPISETDLATFIVDCIDKPDRLNRILPVGGPGAPVTPRQQGELLFRLTGREPKFREVPVGLFTSIAALLTPLGKVLPAAAAKAELARIAHYYATESMLQWDDAAGRYDADATPTYGSVTLEAHYERLLRDGMAGYEAGEQRLF